MPAFPYMPAAAAVIPREPFEAVISRLGWRVSWMRSHTCPCVFGGAGPQGHLPTPGSAVAGCLTCFGLGVYWDSPTVPFKAAVSFRHFGPTPDEPGVKKSELWGDILQADAVVTVPYQDPFLNPLDGSQPTTAWNEASENDAFVPVDMTARYTAVLQVDGIQTLPFQQNLKIAPCGAVTTWNPATSGVTPVTAYQASGATVLVSGLAAGQNYMVEFSAAPVYVAFRNAGGIPHARPFGGGTVNLPRAFRLQQLDLWTRARTQQPTAPATQTTKGKAYPMITMTGQPVTG
jgi:hypothetical protein